MRSLYWKTFCIKYIENDLNTFEMTLALKCLDMWLLDEDFKATMFLKLYMFLSQFYCPLLNSEISLRIHSHLLGADAAFSSSNYVKCSIFHCKCCAYYDHEEQTVKDHIFQVHGLSPEDNMYAAL